MIQTCHNDGMSASAVTEPTTSLPGVEELGELATDPVFLLIRAGAVGRSRGNAVLRELGFKTRDYSILSTAATREVTQKDLASFLMLNPSQVVALVDDLEDRGLVQRTTSPHDRRAKIVGVTAAGRRAFTRARKLLAATHEDLLGPLSEQERDVLLRVLPLLAFPHDHPA